MRTLTGGLMLIACAVVWTVGTPSWPATIFMACVSCVGLLLIVDDL